MTDKDNIEYWLNEVHQGDAREKLKEMPDKSVDMVVTSPPYFGLRDYGDDVESIWGGEDDCKHEWNELSGIRDSWGNSETLDDKKEGTSEGSYDQISGLEKESNYCSKCGAWKGQLGLEPSPIQFVQNLTEICNEIYRVLKPTGSFYLNLGDTYAGGGGVSGKPDDWEDEHNDEAYPDSVPARDVEFPDKCKMLIPHRTAISLMDNGWILRNDIVWHKSNPMPENVKDRRCTSFEIVFHFSKQQQYHFDMEAVKQPYKSDKVPDSPVGGYKHQGNMNNTYDGNKREKGTGRIPRDVITLPTASHPDAHFAVYPKDLIHPFIQSSCPEDGVVLDPFIGSGTTAVVAEELERDWIGIDLNKDYVDMSYDRIENETKKIFDDRSLFDF